MAKVYFASARAMKWKYDDSMPGKLERLLNGKNNLSVGAPVVLSDGLYGNDNIMVKAGEILGEIAIASLIHDVPAMVVCSHVKGHIQAGYGGAIKNVAMGGVSSSHRDCGWKCGRGAMHTIGGGKLIWNKER